ncbi:MAG: SDR family NAD(P)-dependent oxidoreductase, partial [Clostridia bacterium]|nr:SDR family NAD(P)-dependent oxidoreductase [Clostridia bacterium]
MDFKNKVAVITGAAGTLCSEITLDLAKKGVKVAMVDLAAEKLQGLAEKIEAFGGEYMIETGDVTSLESMTKVADNVFAKWGPCDFLI